MGARGGLVAMGRQALAWFEAIEEPFGKDACLVTGPAESVLRFAMASGRGDSLCASGFKGADRGVAVVVRQRRVAPAWRRRPVAAGRRSSQVASTVRKSLTWVRPGPVVTDSPNAAKNVCATFRSRLSAGRMPMAQVWVRGAGETWAPANSVALPGASMSPARARMPALRTAAAAASGASGGAAARRTPRGSPGMRRWPRHGPKKSRPKDFGRDNRRSQGGRAERPSGTCNRSLRGSG